MCSHKLKCGTCSGHAHTHKHTHTHTHIKHTHLQVVLCFSPVGSTLRVRARKFPAIVNCTSIDWFHEWPEEALKSVSYRFLTEGENELLTVSDNQEAFCIDPS